MNCIRYEKTMTMWVNYRANATLDVINKTSFISMSLYKTNRTRITYHRPNEKSNRKAMYIKSNINKEIMKQSSCVKLNHFLKLT